MARCDRRSTIWGNRASTVSGSSWPAASARPSVSATPHPSLSAALASVDDVADAILYLGGDDAKYVTGQENPSSTGGWMGIRPQRRLRSSPS